MKTERFLDEFDLEAEREGLVLNKSMESISIFKTKRKSQGTILLTAPNANKVFNARIGCKYISK